MEIKNGLVSICIVNWNGGEFLPMCIPTVLDQTYSDIEFFIVDNASRDGSPDRLERDFPQIRLFRQKENLGFSGGHNVGIRTSGGEFYMALNFDLRLTPSYVEEMVKAIRTTPETGSVNGKLLRMDHEGNPTGMIDSVGHEFLKTRQGRNRGQGEVDKGQFDRVEEIFGVTGTAPLYRRAMLESICFETEYFDEDFFAYREDVDLDWRARRAGWRAIYTPKAVAYHYRKGHHRPPRHIRELSYRNRYFLMIKNDTLRELGRDFKYISVQELYEWTRMLDNPGKWYRWGQVPKILKLLPRMFKKRRVALHHHGGTAKAPQVPMVAPPAREWRHVKQYLLGRLVGWGILLVLLWRLLG